MRRRMILGVAVSALLVAFLGACASTVPRPEPISPTEVAFGMSLAMVQKVGPLPIGDVHYPGVVLFARLEEGEDIYALLEEDRLIPSSFVDGENAYVLNAPPGTYVAVAALYTLDKEPLSVEVASGKSWDLNLDLTGDKVIFRNYFSKEMITETMTSIEPGSMAFLGRIVANQSLRFGDADEFQTHHLRLLEGPDVSRAGLLEDMLFSSGAYRLSTWKQWKTGRWARRFCKNAKKHLKGTAWLPMVERLREEHSN